MEPLRVHYPKAEGATFDHDHRDNQVPLAVISPVVQASEIAD